MQNTRRERTAILLLLITTMAWGGTFVVVKDGISQMPFMPLMAWRFSIAFALLAAMRPKIFRAGADVVRKAFVIGSISFLGYLFQTIGLQYTTASVSGFITGMFVVITPLIGWIVFRERLGWNIWVAVVVAALGLGLIAVRDWSFGLGEAWTLAGAAMWALQIIYFSRFSTPQTALTLGTLMIGFVALDFVIFTVPQGFEMPPNGGVWAGIMAAAVFATAFAFPAQSWGQSHIDATRAAVIYTMEPVFAMIGGVFFGGDVLTERVIAGAACIFASMAIAEFAGKRDHEVESLPHPSV